MPIDCSVITQCDWVATSPIDVIQNGTYKWLGTIACDIAVY